MSKFTLEGLIKLLSSTSLRGFKREVYVTNLVENLLLESNVEYKVQEFVNYFPEEIESEVSADGLIVKSLPSTFKSGSFTEFDLFDSLTDLEANSKRANINFNSNTKEFISRPSNYFTPSVAVSSNDVDILKNAKKVSVSVKVKKTKYKSKNFLIGNINNPSTISFCHLDSIGGGFVDNSSGSGYILKAVLENKELLTNNLFVISGNEEISYEKPIYWGFGYRKFEKEFKRVMDNTKKIIVVDCVGHDSVELQKDLTLLKLGFPIKNEVYLEKSLMICSSIEKLTRFYHSEADTFDKINLNYLNEGYNLYLNTLSSVQ